MIIKCEFFPKDMEQSKTIPEGTICFQQEWYNYTGYKPEFFNYLKQKEEIQSIITKEHTIIIPMYQYPIPYSNDFIDKYKNKCNKIYAAGPLALLDPLRIKKYIDVDGILGIEPVYSLLYDNARILTNNIPENFYKKESIYLPKINDKYKIRNRTLLIIPGSNLHCDRNCYFCNNSGCSKNQKIYKIDDIIERIPKIERKTRINVHLTYYNIFQEISSKKIQELIDKIQFKLNFSFVSLWIDPKSFIENHNKIKVIDKKIIWNIGFESFSDSQLKRYNTLSYKNKQYNDECVDIINNTKDYLVNPLFIFFDPWSVPEELSETIEGYSRIKKQKMKCHEGGMIWKKDIINRTWSPYPGCKLYDLARNERLLNKKNFNEFEYPYVFDRSNYKEWPWKFKYKEIKDIYFTLYGWIKQIENYKTLIIENKKSKCDFCSGGFVFEDFKELHNGRFAFVELNKKLIEFLNGDKNIKDIITNNIENIYKNVTNQYL